MVETIVTHIVVYSIDLSLRFNQQKQKEHIHNVRWHAVLLTMIKPYVRSECVEKKSRHETTTSGIQLLTETQS